MTHPWSRHPVNTAGVLEPWLACVPSEVAGAFKWRGPPPSESFFFFCYSAGQPRSSVTFRRGRARGTRGSWGCGGEAGAPLTAEASFTHPATHVPLYGPVFSRCLKATEKRAGLILAAWLSPGNRPSRRSFFLTPPPPFFSPPTPSFSFPPCVLCCVSLKLPSQPLGCQQPGPSGASSLRTDRQIDRPAPGVQDPRGHAPRVAALCEGMRVKLQLATFSTSVGAATTVCSQARVQAAPPLPPLPSLPGTTLASSVTAWSMSRGPRTLPSPVSSTSQG